MAVIGIAVFGRISVDSPVGLSFRHWVSLSGR